MIYISMFCDMLSDIRDTGKEECEHKHTVEVGDDDHMREMCVDCDTIDKGEKIL